MTYEQKQLAIALEWRNPQDREADQRLEARIRRNEAAYEQFMVEQAEASARHSKNLRFLQHAEESESVAARQTADAKSAAGDLRSVDSVVR